MLKELVEQCKPEASVRELCIVGDTKLAEETSKAFKKDKKVMKGGCIILDLNMSFSLELERIFIRIFILGCRASKIFSK